MAHVTADFVKETSTTIGAVLAFVLGGARSPARTFSAACSNGDTVHYAASHDTLNEWEVGLGTYASGTNSISRTSILSSSNGGAAVNFSAGTKRIDLVEPAARIVQQVGPVAAGGSTFGSGSLVFSNLNGVSWGLTTNSAGGTLTATYTVPSVVNSGLILVSDGANSVNASRMVFSNTGGIEWSVTTGASVASVRGFLAMPVQAGGLGPISLSRINFSDSNNVIWGINGSTITASVRALTQVTLGFIGSSFSIFTDGSITGQRINLNAGFSSDQSLFSSCNVTFGISGSERIAAIAAINVFGGGSTAFAQHFSFQNTNGVSWTVGTTTSAGLGRVGLIQASFAGGGGGADGFGTVSLVTNFTNATSPAISGATDSTISGSILAFPLMPTTANSFYSYNNVSWRLSSNSLLGAVLLRLLGGTAAIDGQQVSFRNLNGNSWTLDSTTFAGFGLVPRFALQAAIGMSAGTSASASKQNVVFSDSNNVSFGFNSLTLTASASDVRLGLVSHIGGNVVSDVTALAFSNASNVTWSLSTAVGGATVLASVAAGGGGGGIAASAAGSSVNAGTVVWSNSNNVSFSMNGSTIVASASFPAATSLSFSNVAGGVSFGLAGSTITASAPEVIGLVSHVGGTSVADVTRLAFENAFNVNWLVVSAASAATVQASFVGAGAVTLSGFLPFDEAMADVGQVGQSNMFIQPLNPPNFTHDRIVFPVYVSMGASNFTGSIRWMLGIYTRNASTLSLLLSTTFTTSWSFTSASSSVVTGWRNMSFGWSNSLSEGNYWLALASTTAGVTGTLSNIVKNQLATSFRGQFGLGTNDTGQQYWGYGIGPTASSVVPSAINFTAISGANNLTRFKSPRFHFGFGSN